MVPEDINSSFPSDFCSVETKPQLLHSCKGIKPRRKPSGISHKMVPAQTTCKARQSASS